MTAADPTAVSVLRRHLAEREAEARQVRATAQRQDDDSMLADLERAEGRVEALRAVMDELGAEPQREPSPPVAVLVERPS